MLVGFPMQVRPASSAMERFTALSFDEPRMPEPESVDTYEKVRSLLTAVLTLTHTWWRFKD